VAEAAKEGAGRQSASRARSQQGRRSGFINLLGGSKTQGGMQLFKSFGAALTPKNHFLHRSIAG
jgi:hypothetical protein